MCRTVEGYPKNAKMCFIWLRPRYKIPECFTIAPVLTCTLTVCSEIAAIRRYLGCLTVTSLTKTVVLVWPGAATRRSRSKSAHMTIPYNNRRVQNLIQIGRDLAYEGQNLFAGKNRERPSLYLAANEPEARHANCKMLQSLV